MSEYIHLPPNLPLYHYTGIEALLGMASNRELWVGNIHYMNDAEELTHAVEMLQDHLTFTINESDSRDAKRSLFLKAFLRWVEDEVWEPQRHNLYIFSLSEQQTLLSQWRSYTPHGKGISIGFSPFLLSQIQEFNDCHIAKCIYTDSEKADLFDLLIESLYEQIDDMGVEYLQDYAKCVTALRQETGHIIKTLALVKHEAFQEECEWRLISKSEQNAHFGLSLAEFRPGASMLMPYLKWRLPDDEWLFDSILLGPTPHPNLAIASLRALALKYKLTNQVQESRIPYRVW